MLENYSEEIQKLFRKMNVRTGDRIVVTKDKNAYEGLLMPRIELGDRSSVVLKLDNGYNIGIKYGKGIKIQKSKRAEPKAVKEEAKFEMGKEHFKKIKFDSSKPQVAFIVTGGTIISRVDYKTGGVAPLEKPEELLSNVPELKNIVNIKDVTTPFRKASEDLDYKDWQKIATLAAREANKNEGVIIAHGTDTMHFTSAALSFMLKTSKPIVLVGSQRSSDRGSSDAALNLVCAAYSSLSDIAEVGICMHGSVEDDFCSFHRGTRVRKMHTTRRDTFQSLDDFPIAKVWNNGRIEILNQNYRKRSDEKVVADTKFEPKVALVKAYPNSDPEVLNWYVSKGYKGFVIEGTGMGHVPTKATKSWIPIIKKLSKTGIPVVIAPQTLFGRVNRYVYDALRILYNEAGAISGEDMIPETAFVKLGFILGHTKDFEKVREFMQRNVAGEITERSVVV